MTGLSDHVPIIQDASEALIGVIGGEHWNGAGFREESMFFLLFVRPLTGRVVMKKLNVSTTGYK